MGVLVLACGKEESNQIDSVSTIGSGYLLQWTCANLQEAIDVLPIPSQQKKDVFEIFSPPAIL